MPPHSRPSPAAIAAAQRLIRQQTGNNTWRYQNGQWTATVVGPGGGRVNLSPTAAQRQQFASILAYYQTVYPPPLPPPRPGWGSRVVGGALNLGRSAVGGALNLGRSAVGGALNLGRSAVGGALNLGRRAVGGALNLAGRAAGAAIRAPLVLARGLASGALGLVGGVAGLAGSVVGGAATGAVRLAGGALRAAGGVVRGAATGALGLASTALTAFAQAVRTSHDALMQLTRDVNTISDETGAGRQQSLDLVNRFASMGISSERTAAIFGDRNMAPQLFNARAAALGAPSFDAPKFGPQLARWFQAEAKKGLGGFLAARAKLDALFGGQAPPEVLRMANTRPEVLEREAAYGQQVQGALGVNSSVVDRASELTLLENRIAVFVEAIRVKFASVLLPSLEAGFGGISQFLISNADGIANALVKAGEFMYVKAPGLALSAAGTVLDWGEAIANTFFAVTDAGLDLLRSFGDQSGPLFGVLHAGASFIDFMFEFGAQFKGAIAFIQAAWMSQLAIVSNSVPGLKAAISKVFGMEFEVENPLEAYNTAVDTARPQWSAVDSLNNAAQNLKASGWVDDQQKRHDAAENASKAAFSYLHTVHQTAVAGAGTEAERQKSYLERIAESTKQMADNQKETTRAILDKNGQPIVVGSDVLGRIGSYIAEDAYRMAARRG